MDLSKLPDWLKLKPRHLFGLVLAAGILLFSPAALLERLGMTELLMHYRGWIGVVFVASAAVWLAHGLAPAARSVVAWLQEVRQMRTRRATLKHLSPQERAILRRFMDGDTKTITLNISSGVHAGLESRQVIYRASSLSRSFYDFDYNIQPWAWDYLREHPEVLEGPTASIYGDDVQET